MSHETVGGTQILNARKLKKIPWAFVLVRIGEGQFAVNLEF
jgi:hypothetical protein